jgi:hypothetical protein
MVRVTPARDRARRVAGVRNSLCHRTLFTPFISPSGISPRVEAVYVRK